MGLVCSTVHDSFVKLIVSSLDYGREGTTRLILSKALKATAEVLDRPPPYSSPHPSLLLNYPLQLDNIEKDLQGAKLSLYGITTERNRVRLEKLVGDRERWKDITAASMAGRAFRMIT